MDSQSIAPLESEPEEPPRARWRPRYQALIELTVARHEGGDHLIIIGQVERIRYDESESKPLLYYKGRYGAIS